MVGPVGLWKTLGFPRAGHQPVRSTGCISPTDSAEEPKRKRRTNSNTVALNVGDRLGHYDIATKIGEGGTGEVWQATDTKLHRDVALKILPEAFAQDPDRLARFQREAQVLASLNHPNIGHIYGQRTLKARLLSFSNWLRVPPWQRGLPKAPSPLMKLCLLRSRSPTPWRPRMNQVSFIAT